MVVDASLAAAWFLPDEKNQAADLILMNLRISTGLVPSLFWFETRNLLLIAERRGRMKAGEAALSIAQLRSLPLRDDGSGDDLRILKLADRNNLSCYDASYLDLAARYALPLGTLDRRLAAAARAEGVVLLGPLAEA